MDALAASDAQLFWLMGDLTYSDNFENDYFIPESACTGPQKACNLTCIDSKGQVNPWAFECLTTTSCECQGLCVRDVRAADTEKV